jgi:hypothetical protein
MELPDLSLLSPYGHKILDCERLRGGGNNRLYKLSFEKDVAVAKYYYKDDKKRAFHDVGFSELLANSGVTNIARPLWSDIENNVAIFSYINGDACTHISKSLIFSAAEFIQSINRQEIRNHCSPELLAAEASFSSYGYRRILLNRVERLTAIKPHSEIDLLAHEFINDKLLPLVMQLEVVDECEVLPQENRVLSPSDFGFHNCLRVDEKLYYFDFEYAGWDDPCKLVADFFSHPAYKADLIYVKDFINIAFSPSMVSDIKHRISSIFYMIRLKWLCILLNEFDHDGRNRREQALECDINQRKLQQLHKAQYAFENINQDINQYL